jgi:hypothetical protein
MIEAAKMRRTADGGLSAVLETSPTTLIALLTGSVNVAVDNAGSGGRI